MIVHRDSAIIVIDKPAGLIVHPAPGHQGPSVVSELGEMLAGGEPERPGVVHRIDMDTSGLLVLARTPAAHQHLAKQISAHSTGREYVALCEGRVGSRTGTIDAALGRDHRRPERVIVGGRSPRSARTHFEVEELVGTDTLLAVTLETGRTHQIRVHLASIGHPVAGDPRYGHAGRHGLTRQFLHARRLSFLHPDDDREVSFESALPADLVEALELARGPKTA